MNSSNVSVEDDVDSRDIDEFHQFMELAAKNADISKMLCEDIDRTRARLGLPIDTNMEHNFDVQESLAKGMALIDMNIESSKGIPLIIRPWIRAHKTGSAINLIHGCAISIQTVEKESPVARQCMELLQKYMQFKHHISSIPSNKLDT